MTIEKVRVAEAWGAVLVRAQDHNGVLTRHWFDEMEPGTLIHIAEVEQYDDGRHYVEADLMMVPEKVMDVLEYEGYTVKNVVGSHSGYVER